MNVYGKEIACIELFFLLHLSSDKILLFIWQIKCNQVRFIFTGLCICMHVVWLSSSLQVPLTVINGIILSTPDKNK